jgi:heme-degrading monooxygenase HmoA
MEEPYLVSTVSTREGKEEAFLTLMHHVTDAASALGGAGEGFILRDSETPNRFMVVRRWQSEEAMQHWFDSAASKALWADADDIIASYDGQTWHKVADIASSVATDS